MIIPRPEHPTPNCMRNEWINLNGIWEFEIDNELSGIEKEYHKKNTFKEKINVPFCPESVLSGISNTDFMQCVWYKKMFDIPTKFNGKRIILHFGAVDYQAEVYINGLKIGEHIGGYTSFSFDITENIMPKNNILTVRAVDDTRSVKQPSGKQSGKYNSYGCLYTRTTGIWQTVWIEAVGSAYIENYEAVADITTPSVSLKLFINGEFDNKSLNIDIIFNGKIVGNAKIAEISSKTVCVNIPLSEKHLWSVGKGELYDILFTINENGKTVDKLNGYFGLRTISMSSKGLVLNGETIFGRFVLDQGYYPDGIYTAPTDDDLKNDITSSMSFGFNGARLHQKIFEPRFLYWADKLGYLVWEEHANWGFDVTKRENLPCFLNEWVEAVKRDFSHPSIIGWCPFNETWDLNGNRQDDAVLQTTYNVTKALDPTRPVIDTSGFFHSVRCDIYDVHDYEQDADKLCSYYSRLDENIIFDQIERNEKMKNRQHYNGEPVFVSEYGGIKWDKSDSESWGYGNAPKTEEEFIERFKALTEVLMKNKKIFALCYTQLYDVEQERNGLMTYERDNKFDPEIFKNVLSQPAEIEKQTMG